MVTRLNNAREGSGVNQINYQDKHCSAESLTQHTTSLYCRFPLAVVATWLSPYFIFSLIPL
jgi:hypothetical protein